MFEPELQQSTKRPQLFQNFGNKCGSGDDGCNVDWTSCQDNWTNMFKTYNDDYFPNNPSI